MGAYSCDDVAIAYGQAILNQAGREIELLAVMAASPRAARSILRELGVGVEHFRSIDTRCIFVVLDAAGEPNGRPWDKLRMATTARDLLKLEDCWDNDDCRPFASGSRWGPGSISALMYAIGEFDAALLRQSIARVMGCMTIPAIDTHVQNAETQGK